MDMKPEQLELIKNQFKTLKDRSPFYARKFEGIDLSDVQTQEDFEKLPFSEKADLREAYPLGLQAVPDEEVVRIHSSSGTTGTPVIIPYTQQDVIDWATIFARCYETAGITNKDRIQITPGYGLWTAGIGFQLGCERLGAMAIPMGPGNTEKQLKMMQDLHATVITGTSSYALLLAEEMQGQGALYSCDVAEHRVGLIRSAVERMGFAHVTALCNDATRPNPKLPAADRILVDAPCSGLGILAKKPDIRYKTLEKARHDELLATQSSILDTAAALLKAGGRLVYSTCTIDPAENEEQVAAFLARHPEFRVVRPAVAFPDGMTVGEHGALSVPTRTGMDGFFLCSMQKTQ